MKLADDSFSAICLGEVWIWVRDVRLYREDGGGMTLVPIFAITA
jgi:hypothetical protein